MSEHYAARVIFYNLDNGRNAGQVDKEIRALCHTGEPDLDQRPALVGLCEAVGYDLPDIDGFHKIRDRSTKSRANIGGYARHDLFGGNVHWIDLGFTWARTKYDGTHEPRSYVVFQLGQMQAVVYQAPPKNAHNCEDGQQEGIDSITTQMKPGTGASDFQAHRPRFAIADWNRKASEKGPGPTMLANRIDGGTHGAKIDAAVKRGNGTIDELDYPTKVHGVELKSDHGHALRFTLHADHDYWTP